MPKSEEKHNIHVSSFHHSFFKVFGLIQVYPWFKFGFVYDFDIFFLTFSKTPKSLILGLKELRRNRKGKEEKKR